MTEQQAIKILKEEKSWESDDRKIDAFLMGIEALEKQIAKKPKEYEDKYYACECGNILLMKWEIYNTVLTPKSKGLPYCLACGQKLDWSDDLAKERVMNVQKYRYFVSCNINTGNTYGFSNHEIVLSKPITNIDNINEISTMLEKKMKLPNGSVCVLYYQLFDDLDTRENLILNYGIEQGKIEGNKDFNGLLKAMLEAYPKSKAEYVDLPDFERCNNDDFPKRLKELRIQNNLTQKELADIFNVSQNAIFNWENGKREPSILTINKIATFFNVSLPDLLGYQIES